MFQKKISKVIKRWFEDISLEEQKKLIELYESIKKDQEMLDEIKAYNWSNREQEADYIHYNLMNYRITKKYEYAKKVMFAKAKYDLIKEYFDF